MTVIDRSDPAYAGQAAYTPATLRLYDAFVVKFSNSFVWKCPARRLVAHYERHLSASHLDVGPGTGYYLDRASFPTAHPRVALLDPNIDVLEYARRRLRRLQPTVHQADALKPIDLSPMSFGSIGVNYVLHCLPGDLGSKAVVFDHLVPFVAPGGVVFGSTILHSGVRHSWVARRLMPIYNAKRIFGNEHDDLDGLHVELARRFDRYHVEVVGAVALFAGWTAS